MAEVINIKRGLDIKQKGRAENIFGQIGHPEHYSIKPTDFKGINPKMVVKEGDSVLAGSVLFYDKNQPDIKFVSPVSGVIQSIIRGERRKILNVVVSNKGENNYEDLGVSDIATMTRDQVKEKMLQGGVWPFIRQRPFDLIANPTSTPKAIFISAFDSAPLAPDNDFVVNGQEKYLQAAVDALSKFSNKIHIGINTESASKPYTQIKGVEIHKFRGPHPAGNVGIQIHHIDPINKGDIVWVIQPQDMVILGKLMLEGIFDATRIMVVAGSEVSKPAYYRTKIGSAVLPYLHDVDMSKTPRIISGNVLTGEQIDSNGYLGYYSTQLTIVPEGNYHEFLGWATPGFGKYSISRSFFTWLCSKKEYVLDTNMHGGERAIVMSGEYDKVLPMDILPEFLIKAILVDDIDKMEQLGIYEVVEEDLALCEFVCTSKLDVQQILRKGINNLIQELG